jgi:hypothetical protein
VTLTSNGIARTTLITPTASTRGRSTDLGRLLPTQSQKGPSATGGAGIGAGNGSGVSERPSKGNSTAIIAGVVSAFVVIGIICAIIFIRARKKKQTPRDVVSSHYSTRSDSVRNVRTFFSNRFSRNTGGDDGQRANTPALESGIDRTPYMTEVEPPRRRSSSEPATATRSNQISPVIPRQSKNFGVSATGAPMIPAPSPHRRSVSSLAGMAYPVLTNTNNPFMDPDPNAPLRIVNPDLSRSGSVASTPRTPGKRTMAPVALGAAAVGVGAAGAVAAAKMSPSPLKQATSFTPPPSRSMHQRTPSIGQDPFMDPETIMEDPFADSIEPPVVAAARNSRLNHQRNKSSLASSASQYSNNTPEMNGEAHQRLMSGVPLITKTAPSSIASSHRHNGSGDSGFMSSNNSPASVQSARFNGLGISNVLQRSSRSAPRASLLPTSTPRDPSLLLPTAIIAPPPPPPADRRISHNRLSSTSSASDLSLSFPSSWGSPGPTRPASIATQGGVSLAAALAARNGNSTVQRPRDSRASDPFDLDDPTLLSYAASDAGGYNIATLSRENSERSVRGVSHKRADTLPESRRS